MPLNAVPFMRLRRGRRPLRPNGPPRQKCTPPPLHPLCTPAAADPLKAIQAFCKSPAFAKKTCGWADDAEQDLVPDCKW